MNDLYLIGNGFDLAHNMKTSYNDFLLWYLKKIVSTIRPESDFEDGLIIMKQLNNRRLPEYTSINAMYKDLLSLGVKIDFKNDFFKGIFLNYKNYKWVDIEYEYYSSLISLYKRLEKQNLFRSGLISDELEKLNICFALIKEKLSEYLLTVDNSSFDINKKVESVLVNGTGVNGEYKGEKLFVNFNYTRTLEQYLNKNLLSRNLVSIHGMLNDVENPIIFGYGDEIDPFYEKIENLNDNKFLVNIKSFGYFRTNNYQRIIKFIDSSLSGFVVKIIGHSCGISDRILLSTIFGHKRCKGIKIYYHQKNHAENDYFEKTQEISRHFKSEDKAEMRAKIQSFENSSPLIPFA